MEVLLLPRSVCKERNIHPSSQAKKTPYSQPCCIECKEAKPSNGTVNLDEKEEIGVHSMNTARMRWATNLDSKTCKSNSIIYQISKSCFATK